MKKAKKLLPFVGGVLAIAPFATVVACNNTDTKKIKTTTVNVSITLEKNNETNSIEEALKQAKLDFGGILGDKIEDVKNPNNTFKEQQVKDELAKEEPKNVVNGTLVDLQKAIIDENINSVYVTVGKFTGVLDNDNLVSTIKLQANIFVDIEKLDFKTLVVELIDNAQKGNYDSNSEKVLSEYLKNRAFNIISSIGTKLNESSNALNNALNVLTSKLSNDNKINSQFKSEMKSEYKKALNSFVKELTDEEQIKKSLNLDNSSYLEILSKIKEYIIEKYKKAFEELIKNAFKNATKDEISSIKNEIGSWVPIQAEFNDAFTLSLKSGLNTILNSFSLLKKKVMDTTLKASAEKQLWSNVDKKVIEVFPNSLGSSLAKSKLNDIFTEQLKDFRENIGAHLKNTAKNVVNNFKDIVPIENLKDLEKGYEDVALYIASILKDILAKANDDAEKHYVFESGLNYSKNFFNKDKLNEIVSKLVDIIENYELKINKFVEEAFKILKTNPETRDLDLDEFIKQMKEYIKDQIVLLVSEVKKIKLEDATVKSLKEQIVKFTGLLDTLKANLKAEAIKLLGGENTNKYKKVYAIFAHKTFSSDKNSLISLLMSNYNFLIEKTLKVGEIIDNTFSKLLEQEKNSAIENAKEKNTTSTENIFDVFKDNKIKDWDNENSKAELKKSLSEQAKSYSNSVNDNFENAIEKLKKHLTFKAIEDLGLINNEIANKISEALSNGIKYAIENKLHEKNPSNKFKSGLIAFQSYLVAVDSNKNKKNIEVLLKDSAEIIFGDNNKAQRENVIKEILKTLLTNDKTKSFANETSNEALLKEIETKFVEAKTNLNAINFDDVTVNNGAHKIADKLQKVVDIFEDLRRGIDSAVEAEYNKNGANGAIAKKALKDQFDALFGIISSNQNSLVKAATDLLDVINKNIIKAKTV